MPIELLTTLARLLGGAEGVQAVAHGRVDVGRRRFLQTLLAGSAVAATVDVEQLLWTPKPMVTVPAVCGRCGVVHRAEPFDYQKDYIEPATRMLADRIDDWVAQIYLREIETNLQTARLIEQEYGSGSRAGRVGESVQMRLPERFWPVPDAARETVIVTLDTFTGKA